MTLSAVNRTLEQLMSDVLSGFPLYSKVLTYLRSPNWDSRIAAGLAVEAIVKNIPEWDPKPKPKEGQSKEGLLYARYIYARYICYTCAI